jgi:hypothetical protein
VKPRFVVAVVLVAALILPAAGAAPPNKEIARLKRQVAALEAKVRRLETNARLLARATESSLKRELALARRVAAHDPCPITRPNGSPPPGRTAGTEFHGNGAIWVGLYAANVVVDEPNPDASIGAKLGWWRGAPGQLTITGRRLDGTAPPLTASVPDGYGESGFQATGVSFPVVGCWEVTGRVGQASLTFVTLVIAA